MKNKTRSLTFLIKLRSSKRKNNCKYYDKNTEYFFSYKIKIILSYLSKYTKTLSYRCKSNKNVHDEQIF